MSAGSFMLSARAEQDEAQRTSSAIRKGFISNSIRIVAGAERKVLHATIGGRNIAAMKLPCALLLLPMFLPAIALGQPAPITPADLEGATVDALVIMAQVIQ